MAVHLPGHHDVIQLKDKCSLPKNHHPGELQRSFPRRCPQRTENLHCHHMMTPDGDEKKIPKPSLSLLCQNLKSWAKVQLLILSAPQL